MAWARGALSEGGPPLRVVEDERSRPTWSDDLALGILELVEKGATGCHHLANAGDCTRLELAHEIRELDLPVRFHGPFAEGGLNHHPVADVHAFVSGTLARETWGVVLDEATALGLPLILPRFGAYPEHVGDGGAHFYERGDSRDLADVLERILLAPDSLAGRTAVAAERHRTAMTVDEHVRRLLDIYDDARRRGAPSLGTAWPSERDEAAARTDHAEWVRRWDEAVTQHGLDSADAPT